VVLKYNKFKNILEECMRRATIRIIIFIAIIMVSNGTLAHITFSEQPGKKGLLMVFLDDEVTQSDVMALTKATGEMDKRYGSEWVILAKLNSRGGSITAALQIGRLLRNKRAMATVDASAVCLSSCVYILAGATNRAVDGHVGIHRPYEPDGKERSQTSQKKKYQGLEREIKMYLSEVNIPLRLYDDALYISPGALEF
jgi:hypothetical protein